MEAVLLECQTCGGPIALSADGRTGKCEFCGNVYHYREEKSPAVVMGLNEANAYRLKNDFDNAIVKYKSVLTQKKDDADVYWGLALSTFGIEFVEDTDGRYVPTCRRTIRHSILEDVNYLKAMEYASPEQAAGFEKTAKYIDGLQAKIKAQLENEADYDVFICFKSTDEYGRPTKDRFIARRLYDELEKYGIRTFYSEESLKGRIGEDYEPIIYRALYSCRVFILVATDSAYINAPWVKNEWSRFRDRLGEEPGLNGFAVFQGIRAGALPAAFRTQGIDLAKYPAGGYEIEIADNLAVRLGKKKRLTDTAELERRLDEKLAGMGKPVVDVDELEERLSKSLAGKLKGRGGKTAVDLSDRCFQANVHLSAERYTDAEATCDAILNLDPTCAEALWIKIMSKAQVKNDAQLAADIDRYDWSSDSDVENAYRYANAALKTRIAAVAELQSANYVKAAEDKKAERARLGEQSDELKRKRQDTERKIEETNRQLEQTLRQKSECEKKQDVPSDPEKPKKKDGLPKRLSTSIVVIGLTVSAAMLLIQGNARVWAPVAAFACTVLSYLIAQIVWKKRAAAAYKRAMSEYDRARAAYEKAIAQNHAMNMEANSCLVKSVELNREIDAYKKELDGTNRKLQKITAQADECAADEAVYRKNAAYWAAVCQAPRKIEA